MLDTLLVLHNQLCYECLLHLCYVGSSKIIPQVFAWGKNLELNLPLYSWMVTVSE